jgi:hypothetical protein
MTERIAVTLADVETRARVAHVSVTTRSARDAPPSPRSGHMPSPGAVADPAAPQRGPTNGQERTAVTTTAWLRRRTASRSAARRLLARHDGPATNAILPSGHTAALMGASLPKAAAAPASLRTLALMGVPGHRTAPAPRHVALASPRSAGRRHAACRQLRRLAWHGHRAAHSSMARCSGPNPVNAQTSHRRCHQA